MVRLGDGLIRASKPYTGTWHPDKVITNFISDIQRGTSNIDHIKILTMLKVTSFDNFVKYHMHKITVSF